MEPVGGIFHGNGCQNETFRLHNISWIKTGWISPTHNRVLQQARAISLGEQSSVCNRRYMILPTERLVQTCMLPFTSLWTGEAQLRGPIRGVMASDGRDGDSATLAAVSSPFTQGPVFPQVASPQQTGIDRSQQLRSQKTLCLLDKILPIEPGPRFGMEEPRTGSRRG